MTDHAVATVTHLPGARPGPNVDLRKSPEPDSTTTAEEPLAGRVISADDWDNRPDPGDRPLIDPRLRTAEGRAAYAAYQRRRAARAARRFAVRQATTDGILPRAARGETRIRNWVTGVEGDKAAADMATAKDAIRAARAETRRARLAVKDRAARKDLAARATQDANRAVVAATTARSKARRAVAARSVVAYGPVAGAEGAAWLAYGGWGLFAGTALAVLGAARLGRKRADADDDVDVALAIPEEFEPGMTPKVFERMLMEALEQELKLRIKSISVHPDTWGFLVDIVFANSTPEGLAKQLAVLEACLPGVRTSSILLQQSATARNRCTLRIPGSNPWQAVPELPYRAPHSVPSAQLHRAQIGADMSGSPLALPAVRTNINIVGKSRSGKSTILRAELDALTATSDRIVIGIDLGSAGSGFGEYASAMHAVATTPEQADAALQWAMDIGQGRPRLFNKLDGGMGENWVTSPSRPGITIVVDEFPALVRKSRKGYTDAETGKVIPWDLDNMLAEMAITTAKADVTIIIAGQGVTKEKIKDNTWIVELPVQVLAACDTDDITQIVGAGAMAEGWRPDRLLPAMGDAVNDASVAYVMAGGDYCEPIPYRGSIASRDEQRRRATERAKAGLVDIDPESAALTALTLQQLMEMCGEDAGDNDQQTVPQLITTIREAFAAAGDPAGLAPADLAAALATADPARWDLKHFDGDTDDARETARTAALRTAVTSVLEAAGAPGWPLEKYAKGKPRGYRLRDLKAITGEDPDKG